jgi:hypothetical protein
MKRILCVLAVSGLVLGACGGQEADEGMTADTLMPPPPPPPPPPDTMTVDTMGVDTTTTTNM